MKVDKQKFDALLGRLIAAEPIKNADLKKSPRPKKAKKKSKR